MQWSGKDYVFLFFASSIKIQNCKQLFTGDCLWHLHTEGGPLKVWELALEEPAVNKHTYIVPAMVPTVFNYQQRQGIKESFEVGGTVSTVIDTLSTYRLGQAIPD